MIIVVVIWLYEVVWYVFVGVMLGDCVGMVVVV